MRIKNYKSFSELFAEDKRENYIIEFKTKFIKLLSKLNINKRISLKIYVVTAVIMILFLTAMYITINVGYETYYKNEVIQTYSKYVESFSNDFKNIKADDESTDIKNRTHLIADFQNNHSVIKVVIFNENMILEFDGATRYTSDEDITKSATASNEAKLAVAIFDYNKYGSKNFNNRTILTSSISKIINQYLPPYDRGAIYGMTKYKYTLPGDDVPKFYYIFMLSPLQSIESAISSIKSFFVYFYIASIFVVLIVCIILSHIITKPLRAINNVAVKMSSFDFSEKCDDKYKDEIGSLAKSLNLLSSNLQRSLKKLKETNKMLQADIEKERNLEKIRKEFVAAVSHDLNTPVSIIQGYAEGIKDGIFEGEEAEYYLDVIIDETNKMNSLIKDMLDLSALEGGNIAIKKEKYNISDQLIKSIKNLSTMAKERGMRLATRIPEDLYVNADYNRIEQVINNLITNAIKYGNENTDIKINLFEDEEDHLNIEVENEGEPILEEDFKKIWTRFYKIDKSRNRNIGGTGLGLAISKNIIQLHNGEIGGYNKDNAIVFYFKLKRE